MVIDRALHSVAHHTFADLPKFLRKDDLLFRNNASVLPARLHAHRPSGGKVECFLLAPSAEPNIWRCLIKPGKKLPVGATFAHTEFKGEILSKTEDGSAFVRFTTNAHETIVDVANRVGGIPLPPYITRNGSGAEASAQRSCDVERYQTVYADRNRQVAVAAPTAGLHFTTDLLREIKDLGVETFELTLHVGLGTFQPISAEMVENHVIHRECFEMPIQVQRALRARRTGRRIAVGTTSLRTIEAFLKDNPESAAAEAPCIGEASIFIYPPRTFLGVDALITNFHQPRSTLLCLVSAFLAPGSVEGIAWLKEIYQEAISREYRFFSYGDAMLIV